MRVPYRDLRVDNPKLKAEIHEVVERILTHGKFLMGPEVEEFEQTIAKYCGKKYCVGVSSGTNAVYMALRCLDLKPQDEVITTPMSWIATLNAINACGAAPVFADIREDQNIDPDAIERAITPRTKVIMPVHYTGKLCDMKRIMEIARKHNLAVVEDAAQAFGAHAGGKYAGAFGDFGAFSMNPMKVLPSYGEAGAVITDSKEHYDKLIALRYLGTVNREVCYYPSLNSKIDTMQAAMLVVNLKYLEPIVQRRLEIAKFYTDALKGTLQVPEVQLNGKDVPNVFFNYVVQTDRRDELKAFMESKGIEVKIHHPILMPHQPAYSHLPKYDILVAERVVKRILSIPNHEKMSQAELDYVVATIKEFFNSR